MNMMRRNIHHVLRVHSSMYTLMKSTASFHSKNNFELKRWNEMMKKMRKPHVVDEILGKKERRGSLLDELVSFFR